MTRFVHSYLQSTFVEKRVVFLIVSADLHFAEIRVMISLVFLFPIVWQLIIDLDALFIALSSQFLLDQQLSFPFFYCFLSSVC